MTDAFDALPPDDPHSPHRAAELMIEMLADGLIPDQERLDRAIELGERQAGMTPQEALRAAQLWMLDPHREIPTSMPDELCAATARSDPADPAAWAGFTHQGR